MEIGISTLVFGEPEKGYTNSWPHIYRVLASLDVIGYKYVEINTKSLPRSISQKSKHMKRIPEFLSSLQLEVHQIHISNNPGDIGSRDPKLRREAIEWIERSIDFCQVFKSKYVGIHPGRDSECFYDHRLWESFKEEFIIESIRKLARFARERGIKLMLETIGFNVLKLNQIIDSISEEEVGILVDVGHCMCHLKQDPAEVIREAGNRLYSLHIHDNHGKQDEHLVPGEGSIKWGDVLEALKNVRYKGVFMMEVVNSRITRDQNTIARLAKKACDKLAMFKT